MTSSGVYMSKLSGDGKSWVPQAWDTGPAVNTLATGEIFTHEYVNGKPVFQQVLAIPPITKSTNTTLALGLTVSAVEQIHGAAIDSTGASRTLFQSTDLPANQVTAALNGAKTGIIVSAGSAYNVTGGSCIVKYLK